jgi:ABC-type glutathione transport system ATPase component
LAHERQLTVLTISHQATWHGIADIVATIREGRIVALSSPEAGAEGERVA